MHTMDSDTERLPYPWYAACMCEIAFSLPTQDNVLHHMVTPRLNQRCWLDSALNSLEREAAPPEALALREGDRRGESVSLTQFTLAHPLGPIPIGGGN